LFEAMMLSALLLLQTATAGPPAEFESRRVRESSGIAVRRTYSGVLWTHNDSGDGPYLYATDLRGRNRGWLLVPGARAFDWEDIALGPCPPAARRRPAPARQCIYLADTGDNSEGRPSVQVYAVPEPEPPIGRGDTLRATAAPAMLQLRYPDGAHDVEAIYVSPRDSALYLVSKGRGGAIRVYRVAPSQWLEPDVVVAALVQTLDIRPSQEAGRVITGAGVRPDGRMIALRTYDEIYLFHRGVGGRLVPARERPCEISGFDRGGEAIDFLTDSTLVIASEASRRGPGTVRTVVCPR
jgi:hypothetical protein